MININQRKVKVARDGNRHEHMLNETESTLRFGLFMLTLMYFRAMTFVEREKKSWSGSGELEGGKGPKVCPHNTQPLYNCDLSCLELPPLTHAISIYHHHHIIDLEH